MTSAPFSQLLTDPQRLAALARTGMVEASSVEGFDRLTRVGARLLGSTGSFLSVVDGSREVLKAGFGWPDGLSGAEYPWESSFGQHVLGLDEPLVVGDASASTEFSDHEGIRTLGARALLGTPVHANGLPVGVFYIFDGGVRSWSEDDLAGLRDLAQLADVEMGFQSFARAQSQLRGQFTWLMNLLPVAVYACDPNGQLTYFNGRAASLWGTEPALGEPEAKAFAAAPVQARGGMSSEPAPLPAELVLSNAEPFENRELLLGDTMNVLVSGDVLRQDDEVVGSLVVMHDVTALRAADRMRDDLLALVSHELRTPLTIINGLARVLTLQWEALPPRERGVVLEDLTNAGTRVERAVENMLVLSRLEHELNEPEPVHLRLAFDEARVEHQRLFPLSLVEIRIGSPAPVALAVAAWLQLVLVNLLANAELYGDRDQPHSMSAEVEQDGVVVRIGNSGPPLTTDEYSSIFEPFYRRQETAITTPGAGLGLTVARKLIEAQGGTIEAGAGTAGGTHVTIRLPAVPDAGD